MFKCGNKIVTNAYGPGNRAGLDWMIRNLPADTVIGVGETHQAGFGHIDHGWFMVSDDLIFCVNKSWVPQKLRDKELVELQELFEPFDDVKFISDFQSTDGKFSDAWLDNWLLIHKMCYSVITNLKFLKLWSNTGSTAMWFRNGMDCFGKQVFTALH
jgi:hypothetical protein